MNFTDNICSFAEDGDGEIYALMQDGKIFKLTRAITRKAISMPPEREMVPEVLALT